MVDGVAVDDVAVIGEAVVVVVARESVGVDLRRAESEPGAEFTNIRNREELRYFELVRSNTGYISASYTFIKVQPDSGGDSS